MRAKRAYIQNGINKSRSKTNNISILSFSGILKETVGLCKAGASVRDTCINADKRIEEETGKAFKKDKNLQKGIAFPCCISVNNTICHFSPLNSEPDVVLADGDVVKIDMGAHIDGFIAVVAHTVIVSDGKSKITGRKADAVLAAHLCAEAALRLVKPGNEVSIDNTIFSCQIATGQFLIRKIS